MRNVVINSSLKFIEKNYDYNKEKLAELKYGLEAIYILITKTTIILLAAFILGLLKEVFIFTMCYSCVRMFSFGLHATKSSICLVSSLITFILLPFMCSKFVINCFVKSLISIFNILMIYKNSPADTHKRPIISKKRRDTYKFLSTSIVLIMCLLSLLIDNNFISNSLIFACILQNIMVAPTTYKLFNLPYDNYKKYLNEV